MTSGDFGEVGDPLSEVPKFVLLAFRRLSSELSLVSMSMGSRFILDLLEDGVCYYFFTYGFS